MTTVDVILGILMEGSYSGYDLKQMMMNKFSYFYDASFGTIYPTLAKMEREGWITKETVIQEGKPNKHKYSITETGTAKFREYIRSPLAEDVMRSDFLVRLQFAPYVEPEEVKEWVWKSIRQTETGIRMIEGHLKKIDAKCIPIHQVTRLSMEFGIESYRNRIELLNRALEQMTDWQVKETQ